MPKNLPYIFIAGMALFLVVIIGVRLLSANRQDPPTITRPALTQNELLNNPTSYADRSNPEANTPNPETNNSNANSILFTDLSQHKLPEDLITNNPIRSQNENERDRERYLESGDSIEGEPTVEQLQEAEAYSAYEQENYYINMFSEVETLSEFVLAEASCEARKCKLSFLLNDQKQKDEVTNMLVETLLSKSQDPNVAFDLNAPQDKAVLYIEGEKGI